MLAARREEVPHATSVLPAGAKQPEGSVDGPVTTRPVDEAGSIPVASDGALGGS